MHCLHSNIKQIALVAGLAGLMTVVGCGPAGVDDVAGAPRDTIRLAYVNWAEGVAFTHLVSVLLEDMGYQVETTMADVAPIYASVAEGSQDIMIETWLPVTHAAYFERFGERVEVISTWFDDARIGLVVFRYVEIDSIAELNAAKDRFNGRITGIDAGAGIMGTTDTAIEQYELDFELLTSSGPAMTAALQNAIGNEDWIVVTGWAPHWKFARYDLKFLDDPESVYGAVETIHSVARQGFTEEHPEIAAFFGNINFDENQIGTLMDIMEDAQGNEAELARRWIAENQTLVDSWMPR